MVERINADVIRGERLKSAGERVKGWLVTGGRGSSVLFLLGTPGR
jgi:hypothetical protein